MHINTLIIGQGISGTLLSRYLEKAGLSFLIIDESKPNTASKAAAGIINPVTGRRIVKTWMIDELMPFAWEEYQSIEKELSISVISQKKIIDFFPSPQMRQAFLKRYEEDQQYLEKSGDEKYWDNYFNHEFGWGQIQPCYLVDVQNLLIAYRKKLSDSNQLLEENFDINHLIVQENKIIYKNIQAEKIIFCDGVAGFDNLYFKNLPFAPNKGEALIIEAEDFPAGHIYKKGINLLPWKDKLLWVGSSYEWEFQDDQPTELFRKKTEALLRQWLKFPFKIVDHIAAIRPATLERRPFVGFHPIYQNIGLLNGMGTKGCSLAPFFANQFVQHIAGRSSILPEASVNRFANILRKMPSAL